MSNVRITRLLGINVAVLFYNKHRTLSVGIQQIGQLLGGAALRISDTSPERAMRHTSQW